MWKTLACVLGSLWLVDGGPVGPVCSSEINPMPNLNLQKLAGRWYEWSSYGTSAMVPPRRCLAFNFYPNGDGRTLDSLADYTLNTDGTTVATDHKQFVWNITGEVGFGSGELVTNFKLYDGSVTIKSRLVVLDTNYETYLIIYICRIVIGDVENAASESYNMGMILTRKKSYEDYVLADMNQNIDISLKINRIPRGTFKNAAQDYCEDIDFPNTMPVGVDDKQITATRSNQEATSLPEENVEDGIVEFDGTVEQLNVPEGPDKPPLKEDNFSESSNSVDNSLMVTASPGLRNNAFIHDEIALEMERVKKQNNPKENEHQVFDGLDGIASEEFIQRIKGKELLKTVEQLEASGSSHDVIKALEKISPSLTYQEEADDLIAKGGPLAPSSIKYESKPENSTNNSNNSSASNEPDVSNPNNQAFTSEHAKPLLTYTKETIPDELSNDANKPPWKKDSATPNMADDGFNRKSKHTATSKTSEFEGNVAFGEMVSGKPVIHQDNGKEKEGSITPDGSDSRSKSEPLKIEETTHSTNDDVATNKDMPSSDTQPTVEPPNDTDTQSKPTSFTLETENPSMNLSVDLQQLDSDFKPMDESKTTDGEELMSKSTLPKGKENILMANNADEANQDTLSPSSIDTIQNAETQFNPVHSSTLDKENQSKDLVADSTKPDANYKPLIESKTTDGSDSRPESVPQQNEETRPSKNNAPSASKEAPNAETPSNPLSLSKIDKETALKNLVADAPKPDADPKALDESKTTNGSDSRSESRPSTNEENAFITNYADAANEDAASKDHAPSSSTPSSFETSNNAVTQTNPVPSLTLQKEPPSKDFAVDSPKPDPDSKPLEEPKTTDSSDSSHVSLSTLEPETTSNDLDADPSKPDAGSRQIGESKTDHELDLQLQSEPHKHEEITLLTNNAAAANKDNPSSGTPSSVEYPINAEPKSNHVSLSTPENKNSSKESAADSSKPEPDSKPVEESKTTDSSESRPKSASQDNEKTPLSRNNAAVENKDNNSSGIPSSIETPMNAGPESNSVTSSTLEPENTFKDLEADPPKYDADSRPIDESKAADGSDLRLESAHLKIEETTLSTNTATAANKVTLNAETQSNSVSSSTLDKENTLKYLVLDSPKPDADSKQADKSKTTDGSDKRPKSGSKHDQESIPSTNNAAAANKAIPSPGTPSSVETSGNPETKLNPVSSSAEKESLSKDLMADSAKSDKYSNPLEQTKTIAETRKSDSQPKSVPKKKKKSMISTNNAATANKNTNSPVESASVETPGNLGTISNNFSPSSSEKETPPKDLVSDPIQSDSDSKALEQSKTTDGSDLSPLKHNIENTLSTNSAATANKDTPSPDTPASVETPGNQGTQSKHDSSSSSEKETPSKVLASDLIKPDADSKPLEQSKTIDGSDSRPDLAPLKNEETTVSTNNAVAANKNTPSPVTPASVETPGNLGTQSNHVSLSSSEKENPSKDLASDPIKPDADTKPFEQSETTDGTDSRPDLAPLKHEETTVSTNDAVAENKNTPSPVAPASVETPGNLGTQSNHVSLSSSEKENPSKDLAPDPIKPDVGSKPLEQSKTTDGSDSRPDLAPLKNEETTVSTNDAVAAIKNTPSPVAPASVETPGNLGTQSNHVSPSSSEKENPSKDLTSDPIKPDADSKPLEQSKTTDGSDSRPDLAPLKHEETTVSTNDAVAANKNTPSPVAPASVENPDNLGTQSNHVSLSSSEKENPSKDLASDPIKPDADTKPFEQSETTDGTDSRPDLAPLKHEETTVSTNDAVAANKNTPSPVAPASVETPGNLGTQSNHVSLSSSEKENPSKDLAPDPIKPDADTKPFEQSETTDGTDSPPDLAPLKRLETTFSTNNAATANKDTPSSDTPASVETPGNLGSQLNHVSLSSSEKENPSKDLASDPIKPDADTKPLEQSKTTDESDSWPDLAPLKHEQITVSTNNAVAANKNTPSPVAPASAETSGNLGTQSNHVSPSSSEKENPSKDIASDSIKPNADTKPLEQSKTTDGSDSRPDLAPAKHNEPTLSTNDAVAPNKDTPSTGTPSSLETPNNSLGNQYNPAPSSSLEKETPPNVEESDSPNPIAESMLSNGSKTNDGSDSVTNPEPPKHEENTPLTNNPVATNKNSPIAETQPSQVSLYTVVNNDAPNTETPSNPVSSSTLEKENSLLESAVESPKTDAGPKALDKVMEYGPKQSTDSNNIKNNIDSNSAQHPTETKIRQNGDENQESSQADHKFNKPIQKLLDPQKEHTTDLIGDIKPELGSQIPSTDDNNSNNIKPEGAQIPPETSSPPNGDKHKELTQSKGNLNKPQVPQESPINSIDAMTPELTTKGDKTTETSQTTDLTPGNSDSSKSYLELSPKHQSVNEQALVGTSESSTTNEKSPHEAIDAKVNQVENIDANEMRITSENKPNNNPSEGKNLNEDTNESQEKHNKEDNENTEKSLEPSINSKDDGDYLKIPADKFAAAENDLKHSIGTTTENKISSTERETKQWEQENVPVNEKDKMINEKGNTKNHQTETTSKNQSSKEKDESNDLENAKTNQPKQVKEKDKEESGREENGGKREMGTNKELEKGVGVDGKGQVNEQDPGNQAIKSNEQVSSTDNNASDIKQSTDKVEEIDISSKNSPKNEATVITKHPMGPLSAETHQVKGEPNPEQDEEEEVPPKKRDPRKTAQKEMRGSAISSASSPSKVETSLSEVGKPEQAVTEKQHPTTFSAEPSTLEKETPESIRLVPNQDEYLSNPVTKNISPTNGNAPSTNTPKTNKEATPTSNVQSTVENNSHTKADGAPKPITPNKEKPTYKPPSPEKKTDNVLTQSGPMVASTLEKETPSKESQVPSLKQDESSPKPAIETNDPNNPNTQSEPVNPTKEESKPTATKPTALEKNQPIIEEASTKPVAPKHAGSPKSQPAEEKPTSVETMSNPADKKGEHNEHNKKSDDNKDDSNNDDDDNDDDIPPTPARQVVKKPVRKKPVSKAAGTQKKKVIKRGTASPTKKRATANAS